VVGEIGERDLGVARVKQMVRITKSRKHFCAATTCSTFRMKASRLLTGYSVWSSDGG
jgi:hypothetical protein